MSDWENTFGAGVSAESVIDEINAAYLAEQRREAAEAKRQELRDSLAYRSEAELKESLLRNLRKGLSSDERRRDSSDMALLFDLAEHEFGPLEERYRIPESLCRLIARIYTGLRVGSASWGRLQEDASEADAWLIECFDAIAPGVDLRFEASRFLAQFAMANRPHLSSRRDAVDASTRIGHAAIDILCSHARGVLVQNELIADVQAAIAAQFREAINDLHYTDLYAGEATLVVLAFALQGNAAMAAEIAVETRLSHKISGDTDNIDYWRIYARELIELLKTAPVQRLKIIDLNLAHEASLLRC